MQSVLANTITLSCSCLLKRGEHAGRATLRSLGNDDDDTPELTTSYDFCTFCEPRKCGFHFNTIICRKCSVLAKRRQRQIEGSLSYSCKLKRREARHYGATVRTLRNDDDAANSATN